MPVPNGDPREGSSGYNSSSRDITVDRASGPSGDGDPDDKSISWIWVEESSVGGVKLVARKPRSVSIVEGSGFGQFQMILTFV